MSREFVIYCDESDQSGHSFSNFFGGVLVDTREVDAIRRVLSDKKAQLNLNNEVKWSRVSENYLEKYIQLMELFFDLVRDGKVKVRIMFTQNINQATGLTSYHHENRYFLHYYQFVKHAFGLHYAAKADDPITLRLYFDHIPNTIEKAEIFKDYIYGLNRWPSFVKARISIERDNIVEVDSKAHVLAQCLDIVLGSMSFRLNDKHLEKPVGSTRRGKRTIAKESLYRYINSRIREIYPGFNIGISTGTKGDLANRWHMPYRHWLFVPSNQ